MRLDQVAVERERALIGVDGIRRLPGALASHAEIIPRLRVRGQKFRGRLELLHRRRIVAALQQFFALEQRARAGRRASENEKCKRQKKNCAAIIPNFFGQHRRMW